MVVADDDPPRKRSRLSLKSKKGDHAPPADDADHPALESAGTVPQGPLLMSEQELNDCSPPVIDLTESDLPSDGPGVPPVASMENLGNTCYLNCVLEVLRYTPCFLEGLEEVYRHIVYLEKIKTSEVVQGSEEVKTDPSLAWDLVKNMFKMYKRMEKREEMFVQFASADVTSMAVKPDKVLDVIRDFNPMFEGYMQHDAQELLRCLLCYLEDSEKQLRSDYAGILVLDPSLLKTPGPLPVKLEVERSACSSGMEKFLSLGKSKTRRGKSAVMALKFEQSSEETDAASKTTDQENKMDKLGGSHQPTARPSDLLDAAEVKTDESSMIEEEVKVPRKRKFRRSKLKKEVETNHCDEVDSVGKKNRSSLSPGCVPSIPENQNIKEEEEEEPDKKCSIRNTRRSAQRKKHNGQLDTYLTVRSTKTRGRKSKANTCVGSVESDNLTQVSNEVKESDKSCVDSLTNGDHVETSSMDKFYSADKPEGVDSAQPTILSMFGKRSGQCRRLGMRGRPVSSSVVASQSLLPPDTASDLQNVSSDLRRSPRKSNSVHPVAMTVLPQKQNGDVSPSASPARPDDFPTLLDYASREIGHRTLQYSPVSTSAWDTSALASQKKCSPVQKGNGVLTTTDFIDVDSYRGEDSVSELPDLPPVGDLSNPSHHIKKEILSPVKPKLESSLAAENLPPMGGLGNPSLLIKKETLSPVKPELENSLAAEKSLSPTKTPRVSSPLRPDCLSLPSQGMNGKASNMLISQPSKLMIKLEKCDHLCNSPTISASAALKALKGTSSTCRKMEFGCGSTEETMNEQDSDEDEVSLGTKSSFKSVPLKSVCVKVEKCDVVCDSPEKSVSARFATSCLARQRVQRFNMIEKLFQGTMMMRTKCLECERCTERKESFQDVSVPLSAERNPDSDSDTDEEKDSSLLRLMRAFTDVERLRDDNKYYCEQCFRYVEAERSLHYEALPNILTVHLKRFSATGLSGCLSKINDHVMVPLLLSCLRYKCPKPCVRPDHRYTLFAIITHAGSTISAGHYLSYIKVRPNAVGHETLSTYMNDSPKKHFDPSCQDEEMRTPTKSPQRHQTPSPKDSPSRKTRTQPVSEKGDWTTVDGHEEQPADPMSSQGDGDGQSETDSSHSDYHWLECDDETIRILSEKEFHGRLLEKEGALRGTPYVLFYHRLDAWRAK